MWQRPSNSSPIWINTTMIQAPPETAKIQFVQIRYLCHREMKQGGPAEILLVRPKSIRKKMVNELENSVKMIKSVKDE